MKKTLISFFLFLPSFVATMDYHNNKRPASSEIAPHAKRIKTNNQRPELITRIRIENGKIVRVDKVQSVPATVSTPNEKKQPSLNTVKAVLINHALYSNKTTTALSLIQNSDNVNIQDSANTSPLLAAIQMGSQDAVELLIAKGANINALSHPGTPLSCAINTYQSKIVSILLNKGAIHAGLTQLINKKIKKHGITTVQLDNLLCIRSMLAFKVIEHALQTNKVDTARKLAQLPMPLPHNVTPLHIASLLTFSNQHAHDIVKLFSQYIQTKGQDTPLHQAIIENNIPMARALIWQNADYSKGANTETPLQLAKKLNRTKILNIIKLKELVQERTTAHILRNLNKK